MIFLPVLGFPHKPCFRVYCFQYVLEQNNSETLENNLGGTRTKPAVAVMKKLVQRL